MPVYYESQSHSITHCWMFSCQYVVGAVVGLGEHPPRHFRGSGAQPKGHIALSITPEPRENKDNGNRRFSTCSPNPCPLTWPCRVAKRGKVHVHPDPLPYQLALRPCCTPRLRDRSMSHQLRPKRSQAAEASYIDVGSRPSWNPKEDNIAAM